jgi:hypothetical protein
MLLNIEPRVGVELNGDGISAEVHHPTMPRSPLSWRRERCLDEAV